jgi:hypothetical protein
MKHPSFVEGAGLALAASVTASLLFGVLAPVFGSDALLRGLIALLALAYLVYLLRRSRARRGRVSVIAGWALATLALLLWHPPLLPYLMLHTAMLWLIRALYHYASGLSALADLSLNALALCAAVWSAAHTASLFLSVWCFFLVQALFVAIPRELPSRHSAHSTATPPVDSFQQAHRAAEAALRRLSSVR